MKLVEMLGSDDILGTNIAPDVQIKDIKYTSKKVEKGDAFVAVKGSKADGHDYIADAVARGAVCIVCETQPQSDRIPYVMVENSRLTLAKMSKKYFGSPDERLTLIGVTGTNGKTSTTSFLHQILTQKYGDCVGLIGTNRNVIGQVSLPAENTTPQSYELYKLLKNMVDKGCRYCIMEVSSHALDQHRTAGLRFETGVFTNLTRDHLDYHITLENYRNAKAKLFEQSRISIVNADDGTFDGDITYSARSDKADIRAENITLEPGKTAFDLIYQGKAYPVTLPVPGMFTVYNVLAAISAALILGLKPREITEVAGRITPPQGRCERVECDLPFDVMIDYAHTPDGMRSVLSMMRSVTRGRLITVFGCGGDRDKTKRPLMGQTAACYSDKVIITSDNVRSEKPLSIIYDILGGIRDSDADADIITDRKAAIHYAMRCAKEGDTVLLLGKGHEKYMEKNGVKTCFDEGEIVREYK